MKRLTVLLVIGDLLIGLLSLYSGYILHNRTFLPFAEMGFTVLQISTFLGVMISYSFLAELYSDYNKASNEETIFKILIGCFFSFSILSAMNHLIPRLELGNGILGLSMASFGLYQCVWHTIFKLFNSYSVFAKRVLVYGTGPLAEKMGTLIATGNNNHILRGYVTCPNEPRLVPGQYIIYDSGVSEAAIASRAHKIVISLSNQRGTLPVKEILNCKMSGIEVIDAPSFYEEMTGKLLIESIRPSWFIFSDGFKITSLKKVMKRSVDFVCGTVVLIISLPLIPLIAVAIKFDSRGPVLFRQTRVGERDKKFVLYKFRTMRDRAEDKTGAVWASENDERITRVGAFLRKTRLDELPQLFNVLRGDMSFVGPRPERPEFVKELSTIIPYYSERHVIKPGITGWAQVRYPYGASIEDAIEKLRYDLYYIKHLSLSLDFLVLIETIKVVLFRKGSR